MKQEGVWVGHLNVGDVVRLIRGELRRDPSAKPLEAVMEDGTIKDVPSSRGKRGPEIGNEKDFRMAYDTYTVSEITNETVVMYRPYLILNPTGTIKELGVERQEFQRLSYYYWFEVLAQITR